MLGGKWVSLELIPVMVILALPSATELQEGLPEMMDMEVFISY